MTPRTPGQVAKETFDSYSKGDGTLWDRVAQAVLKDANQRIKELEAERERWAMAPFADALKLIAQLQRERGEAMTTPTPRTDRHVSSDEDDDPSMVVHVEFARDLERELALAQKRITALEDQIKEIDTVLFGPGPLPYSPNRAVTIRSLHQLVTGLEERVKQLQEKI